MADAIPSDVPALAPPPGVTSNFVNPVTLTPAVYAVAIITMSLMTIAIAIRIFTKVIIANKVKHEEFFAVFAWAGFLSWHSLFCYMSSLGIARHQWDIRAVDAVYLLYLANIAEILYTPSMFAAKYSILMQLRGIFCTGQLRDGVWWVIHALVAVTIAYYTACFFALIFQCWPRQAIWDPLAHGQCIDAETLTLAAGIVNMVLDIGILATPLWAIWNLQISMYKKLGASTVFAVGFFTCIIAGFGVAYRVLLVLDTDETWSIAKLGLWTMSENLGTVVVGCLPSFPKFFRYFRGRPTETQQSYNRYNPPSRLAPSKKSSKKVRGANSLAVTTVTDESYWNSSEYHELEEGSTK